jgi:hypothetical protein
MPRTHVLIKFGLFPLTRLLIENNIQILKKKSKIYSWEESGSDSRWQGLHPRQHLPARLTLSLLVSCAVFLNYGEVFNPFNTSQAP